MSEQMPSTEEDIVLYSARKKIFPKRASGHYRKLKWILMIATLVVYYITPWLRWDRGPTAPDQAVLVDIANRRFYAFFIEIWPQEFYFVAGMLVMAGIGLFLITSVVGRAWCGYACPQTVWTDLFLVVERAIEGERNARMKLNAAPYTFPKIYKRVLKHTIWLLIGLATGGAWVFYFADAPTLLIELLTGKAAYVAYATIAVLTFTTYTFGGLMREQVCNYMCPWPRIQSAMLDEDSLVVTYNDWRGEPKTRGVKKAIAAGESPGDCVDCNACVVVCPAGIDIRDGQQMECITCALCIDACDDIMGKLGREKGLISYSTLKDYNANMAIATDPVTKEIDPNRIRTEEGKLLSGMRLFDWKIFLRPRTILYSSIWATLGVAILVGLLTRDRMSINVQHDRNPVSVVLSDGSIRNGYTVKILNMLQAPRVVFLSIDGLPGATMHINDINQPDSVSFAVKVEPDKLRALRVFIKQPKKDLVEGQTKFKLIAKDMQSNERDEYDAVFEIPKK